MFAGNSGGYILCFLAGFDVLAAASRLYCGLQKKESNMTVVRPSERAYDEKRALRITRNFTCHAEGSVLIEMGDTKVICTASVQNSVPGFLRGKGQGWVTAEYGMLPRSTGSRMDREAARGKQSGRTQEIQRLIGRSLRAAIDLTMLGENTIYLDCDVIQADGGTRTASITGAYIALADAIAKLQADGLITGNPCSSKWRQYQLVFIRARRYWIWITPKTPPLRRI